MPSAVAIMGEPPSGTPPLRHLGSARVRSFRGPPSAPAIVLHKMHTSGNASIGFYHPRPTVSHQSEHASSSSNFSNIRSSAELVRRTLAATTANLAATKSSAYSHSPWKNTLPTRCALRTLNLGAATVLASPSRSPKRHSSPTPPPRRITAGSGARSLRPATGTNTNRTSACTSSPRARVRGRQRHGCQLRAAPEAEATAHPHTRRRPARRAPVPRAATKEEHRGASRGLWARDQCRREVLRTAARMARARAGEHTAAVAGWKCRSTCAYQGRRRGWATRRAGYGGGGSRW
jgi:hypothetical protein